MENFSFIYEPIEKKKVEQEFIQLELELELIPTIPDEKTNEETPAIIIIDIF